MIVSTPFIVLDKHPCRESALLLRGASPDYGKMAVMLHRAESIDANHFALVDKFRELEIEFKDDRPAEVRTLDRMELTTDFTAVADKVKNFAMAERIGAFLLKNLPENLPQPYTYDALRSVLSQLSGAETVYPWTLEQCAVVIKCTYLYENGLLPDGCTERQSEFLENLVAAGIDNSELPPCDPGYWGKLNSWLNTLLEYQNLSRN